MPLRLTKEEIEARQSLLKLGYAFARDIYDNKRWVILDPDRQVSSAEYTKIRANIVILSRRPYYYTCACFTLKYAQTECKGGFIDIEAPE